MSNDNLPPPYAMGVSRDADSPGGKSVLVAFNRVLTDDELRALHDQLCQRDAVAAASGAGVPAGGKIHQWVRTAMCHVATVLSNLGDARNAELLAEDVQLIQDRLGELNRAFIETGLLAAASAPDRAAGAGVRDPVAVICDTWELRWIGSGPVADIVHKHGLKIGDKLYGHPAATEARATAKHEFTCICDECCKIDLSTRDAALEEAAQKAELQFWSKADGMQISDAIRALRSKPAPVAAPAEAVTDVFQAQANAVLGFAKALVDVGICDAGVMRAAEGTAKGILAKREGSST